MAQGVLYEMLIDIWTASRPIAIAHLGFALIRLVNLSREEEQKA